MRKNIAKFIAKPGLLVSLLLLFMSSCGTLGGFELETFHVGKKQLNEAIDTFHQLYPEYNIPEKWKQFNNWEGRGYGFLEGKIFYFKNPPEEMYYVTIYGDSAIQANPDEIKMAVRAVCRGTGSWNTQSDCNAAEVKRVQDRFHDEVVARLNGILAARL